MPQSDIEALVHEYLPLVPHIVAQVAVQFPRHIDARELGQAGSLGLMQAAMRFDPSRGVPFRLYASHRIKGAVLDAVRKADWAPRSVRQGARLVEVTRQRLASESGASPTATEVAAAAGMTEADLARVEGEVVRSVVLALDETVTDLGDESVTLGEVLCDRTLVEPEETLEIQETHGYLRDAVELLPPRHRQVIERVYFDGWSNERVARELEVSQSRVSQLRTEALGMLREGIAAQYEPPDGADPKGRVARRRASYAAAVASHSTWRARLERRAPVARYA